LCWLEELAEAFLDRKIFSQPSCLKEYTQLVPSSRAGNINTIKFAAINAARILI
jgi:hypothetical protein